MTAIPLPRLAIVIDDMGLNEARSLKALGLPGPLTMSFLTSVSGLTSWAARARSAGHEVLAHIPMQPLTAEIAGMTYLRVSMTASDVRAEVARALDGWTGYAGANNHMGSRFCQDRRLMDVVMSELKARNLFWLDSKTTAETQGLAAAAAAGVPCVVRDVFLDNVATVPAVSAQLKELEAIAVDKGFAIGIGHPHDATIDALAHWIATLDKKGLVLAGLV